MATTETFYRRANVSRADATASLFKRYNDVDLVSFVQKKATAPEARAAGANEGDAIYVATIRVAEFPPSDKDESSDDSSSEESAPKEKSKPEGGESSDDTSSDDSESSDSAVPEFGGGDDEGLGGEPKKLSPEEETNHLLQQILDALQGGAGPAGPDPLGGPGGDLGLPDVGAPAPGEGLPPAPGGPGATPLPPPVKQKSPVGVGAFAHVADQAEISFVRSDANEIGNRGIMAEAAEVMPTHKVARIQRTGTAVINGGNVKLAEKNIAVVTLVAK